MASGLYNGYFSDWSSHPYYHCAPFDRSVGPPSQPHSPSHYYYDFHETHGHPYSPAPLADIPFQLEDIRKYPDIHPILIRDETHLRYDARSLPKLSISATTYENFRDKRATTAYVERLRLISRDFPWTIDIVPKCPSTGITCGDVWKALHAGLQEKLVDSDWAYLSVASEEQYMTNRKAITEAMAHRGGDSPIRVDWLGDRNIFTGIERDDAFARRRLLPGGEYCAETWIVRMDR